MTIETEVLVIGAGPGGYTAAFRAADLGRKVTLVERFPVLGGVCLNVGCIPSKALLHLAELIYQAGDAAAKGIDFGTPKIDLDKVRAWKERVVKTLNTGLAGLAKQRQVQVVQGVARFTSPHEVEVEGPEGSETVRFQNAIIAAGSRPVQLPGFPDDPRIMDSTGALALEEIPGHLLVVGAGVIGLEMACVYHALGAKISVVELADQILPGTDPELIRPLLQTITKRYENIWLRAKVTGVEAGADGLTVRFEGEGVPDQARFDRILVAVGRRPNSDRLNLAAAGIDTDERGLIPVDEQMRTQVPHIFAIGDLVPGPMLAHKASHEGKIAAEVIAGEKVAFQALTIPAVAYTDPEVAWMGRSEADLKEAGIEYDKAVFPWAASGRALAMGRREGLTKLLCDRKTRRILGAGITGPHAGELISEAVLALEMGADAEDLALTIHPHPTLSETLMFAAEMLEGSITDLYLGGKKK
ncbi:dihydrolipoamide dehydrogenase [Methylomarinovum tepidoasis]|uniref:Dihydrolipoyl dehydrogenase n=1 Tax=Methylomarinovum tepidoasis TaxID=2840183 RepID=A0AAU9CYI0_9GAMM|nr:dihydrolipoyl dehydrogenase [Methylomarinovum sp. IN45]BCX89084.1 dihydrolipoamide dehydrogenase [Methylomarinovum sp. IN45]